MSKKKFEVVNLPDSGIEESIDYDLMFDTLKGHRRNKILSFYEQLRKNHRLSIYMSSRHGAKLPYNTYYINDDQAVIEIAVAGYRTDDLSVSQKNNIMCIATRCQSSLSEEAADIEYEPSDKKWSEYYYERTQLHRLVSHQGITQKEFTIEFFIPSDHTLKLVNAVDGILTIEFDVAQEQTEWQHIAINSSTIL